MAGIIWSGVDRLEAKLAELAAGLPIAAGQGLWAHGNDVLRTSLRITPIDTGNLRASGHVRFAESEHGLVVVEVVFGGAAAGYAVYVHEIISASHNPPTQAKFLEQPALESAPKLLAVMAERLQGLVKAG